MTRIISLAAAFATSAMLLGATAGHAQIAGGYYIAVPMETPAKPKLMTRSTPWSLQGGAYVAAKAPERDRVLCELVARDVGKLSSFSVDGKSYDTDTLEKCNARAR